MKVIRSSIVPLLVFFAMAYSGFAVNASALNGGGPDCNKHPENPNCAPTQVAPTDAPTDTPDPTECPGASCEDVPGNECDIQNPERNPHCDDTATPESPTATPVPTDTPVPTEGPSPTATTEPTEGSSPTPTSTPETQPSPTPPPAPHTEPKTGPGDALPIGDILTFVGFIGIAGTSLRTVLKKSSA